ncbi:glycosyltransferase [Hazenella sp. IB182357]|uniref:Glycosyltransferase n=1 Tax=Polycladospora coralii TaxID=2771432 RepID=A0A926NBA2_9BACL|nr:glycosyltransferase [Polycladospora coralii]MBS7530923.1 glycosyltransferase [Polycladospora coralii]
MKKTSIIILTHNEYEQTKRCLDGIRAHTPEPIEIIIVDNGSTDQTRAYLNKQSDLNVIYNDQNEGFPKGCNQGIQQATGDYLLFLNNDTVVTPQWLHYMLDVFERHPHAGIVGPMSNHVSGPFQSIPASYRELTDLDHFARSHSAQNRGLVREVKRLTGICMLVRKEVISEVGFFDEQFGIGTYEDDDFCWRVVEKGYSLFVALDVFIHHEGNTTFSQLGRETLAQTLQRNQQLFQQKWGNRADDRFQLVSPITISLCLIVKNEEEVLGRCLDSIHELVDEINIIDTGSTDRTKEIAQYYTERIFDFEWIDDFAAARNYAFDQARCEYILWLDADDYFTAENRMRFRQLRKQLDLSVDAVSMPYELSYDDDGNVSFSVRRHRLVKRLNGYRWHGVVHEYLEVGGHILQSDVAVRHSSVEHDSDRNLRIYEKQIQNGQTLSPRDQYYYGNELREHQKFEEAIEIYQCFITERAGWVEDTLSACGYIYDCYQALDRADEGVSYLFHSFHYAPPRGEICCRLGYYFMNKDQYESAIYWFTAATQLEPPDTGFVNMDCYTWLPHIQLCVCYDHIRDFKKAYEHNEQARQYRPKDPSVLHNKAYFEKQLDLQNT